MKKICLLVGMAPIWNLRLYIIWLVFAKPRECARRLRQLASIVYNTPFFSFTSATVDWELNNYGYSNFAGMGWLPTTHNLGINRKLAFRQRGAIYWRGWQGVPLNLEATFEATTSMKHTPMDGRIQITSPIQHSHIRNPDSVIYGRHFEYRRGDHWPITYSLNYFNDFVNVFLTHPYLITSLIPLRCVHNHHNRSEVWPPAASFKLL
jgi:hypothetical protein